MLFTQLFWKTDGSIQPLWKFPDMVIIWLAGKWYSSGTALVCWIHKFTKTFKEKREELLSFIEILQEIIEKQLQMCAVCSVSTGALWNYWHHAEMCIQMIILHLQSQVCPIVFHSFLSTLQYELNRNFRFSPFSLLTNHNNYYAIIWRTKWWLYNMIWIVCRWRNLPVSI